MRVLGLAFGVAFVFSAHAAAADARFEKSLQMLAPDERLEQLCDYTAMVEIRKHPGNHTGKYRPDRAIANAMAEPRLGHDKIETKGGAFRSRGKWYAMTYACAVTPDHLKVTSFHFTVGDEIPETKWAGYHLWD